MLIFLSWEIGAASSNQLDIQTQPFPLSSKSQFVKILFQFITTQMIAPRDIYELADTVEAELLAQEGADLEQVNQILNIFHELKNMHIAHTHFFKD